MDKMKWNTKENKTFWKLLSKLENKKNDDSFIKGISGETWKLHFENILQDKHFTKNKKLPQNTSATGPLDNNITKEEVDIAAYILRQGKSPGIDNISYEMIACLLQTKPEILVKLFNSILKNPMIIQKWNTSMITPIHKKGSKSNPDNYRGISLISCFSNFFCAILNQRLMKFVISRKLLSKSQLGYIPGNRTSDALLILHNLIDYYCKKNKKYIYGCFVDFSKAFDTIPRNKLFQKLLNYNICGKFYDCLTMLYAKDKVCVKLGDKVTDNFRVNQGVKQGCILSPLLFNIYLADLATTIDLPENDPVILSDEETIGCLIWADDLLLLSQSELGLKKMLDNLNIYAKTNGLKINIEKTKVMIFNKTGRHIRRYLQLGETQIETCNEYKYLGIKITPFGGTLPILNDLKDRALKAYYKMKHQMGPYFRKHPQITLRLFQTLIQPIILYVSDFWGILKQPKNNPIENLHMKFCKDLLGVQKQTTNLGVLLELGQTPITLIGKKNAIKNWVRICNKNNCNKLVISSHQYGITKNLSWHKNIKNTLSLIGMQDKFLNKDANTHTSAFKRLSDIFHQTALADITKENSKLITYSQLKNKIGYEEYLSQIKNMNHRIILTKFRLSNHNLRIETGRHQRVNKELRFCPFCPNKVEDEKHFLLECSNLNYFRERLYNDFKTSNADFVRSGENEKFVILLTNPKHNEITAHYLDKMFHYRELLLNKRKNFT